MVTATTGLPFGGRRLGAALAILALAACAGPAGSRQMSCPQSCNRDYDVCSDSAGAGRGGGGSFFGAGAACQRQLTACLKSCEVSTAQAKPAAKDPGKAKAGDAPKPPGPP